MIDLPYTPTVFNEGAAPGISADELNKFGAGIQTAQAAIDAAASNATPSVLAKFDAAGRMEAAAPSTSTQVARKAEIDSTLAAINDLMRCVSMGGMV